jgi:hypothetical protein
MVIYIIFTYLFMVGFLISQVFNGGVEDNQDVVILLILSLFSPITVPIIVGLIAGDACTDIY